MENVIVDLVVFNSKKGKQAIGTHGSRIGRYC